MNRRVMLIVVAGALLAVGTAALGVAAAGGGNPDRPVDAAASPTKVSPWAASNGGGIELTDDVGFTDGNGQIAGAKPSGSETDPAVVDGPSIEVRSEGGGDVIGSQSDDGVLAGSKPGLGAGSGGIGHNTDSVEAGGLNGGVVGSRSGDTVLAGGAAGGVVGSRSGDTVFAGSKPGVGVGSGGSILNAEPVQAGGKGGLFGDC